MSFFVKAAIESLKACPELNAEIRDNNIVYRNFYDISVAVGGGKGLVVPVLRNAELLSFAEIEQAIGDFAARAKSGQLKPDELMGGTFTITNGGVFGSMLSTPIVNPPQSGILGLHAIQERPVARDGQVVIRAMMYVALTYDHRIVNGREAVGFLKQIKELHRVALAAALAGVSTLGYVTPAREGRDMDGGLTFHLRKRTIAVLLLIAAAVAAVMPLQGKPGELPIYMKAAERILRGQQIYRPDDSHAQAFTYPPFFVLPMLPLAPLPPWVRASVWWFINLVLAGVILFVLARWVWPTVARGVNKGGRPAWVLAVCVAVLSARFLVSPLEYQSHDLIVFALVVLAGFAMANQRGGWAGICGGLAAACKATPLLLLPLFCWQRRYRGRCVSWSHWYWPRCCRTCCFQHRRGTSGSPIGTANSSPRSTWAHRPKRPGPGPLGTCWTRASRARSSGSRRPSRGRATCSTSVSGNCRPQINGG